MQILITNDDGIEAPGILELAQAFSDLGQVIIVAPEVEQSGVGHALTFLTPLFMRELPNAGTIRRVAVNGTPSDCARLGILEICDQKPDLVLSGINGGLNVGINSVYSGTVAGAREAAFFDIPSFAISLEVLQKGQSNSQHVQTVSEFCKGIVPHILSDLNQDSIQEENEERRTEKKQTNLFNINFPIAAIENAIAGVTPEVDWVPMETHAFRYEFFKGNDPVGRPFFWTHYKPAYPNPTERSDFLSVKNGNVSITPMTFDQTDQSTLSSFSKRQSR